MKKLELIRKLFLKIRKKIMFLRQRLSNIQAINEATT